jgi:hypothetical protein
LGAALLAAAGTSLQKCPHGIEEAAWMRTLMFAGKDARVRYVIIGAFCSLRFD